MYTPDIREPLTLLYFSIRSIHTLYIYITKGELL